MKEIAMLAEMIREELCDAEKYAKKASEFRDDDRQLSNMFKDLAEQELSHSTMEHDQAVRLINAYSGDAPKSMEVVWKWEHEKYIDHVVRIKSLLSMLK